MDIFQITGAHLLDTRKRTIDELNESKMLFLETIDAKYVHCF